MEHRATPIAHAPRPDQESYFVLRQGNIQLRTGFWTIIVESPGMTSIVLSESAKQLQKDVFEVIQDHEGRQHAIWDHIGSGAISLEQFKLFAKYYYYHVLTFRRYIAGLLTAVSDEALQRVLADNLADEYGLYGDISEYENISHPGLYRSFLRSLGVLEATVKECPVLPGYLYYRDFHLALLASPRTVESIGAVVFGMESTTPYRHTRVARGIELLSQKYGSRVDSRFFDEHSALDDHHSLELAQASVSSVAEQHDAVIRGAVLSLDARKVFLDDLLAHIRGCVE